MDLDDLVCISTRQFDKTRLKSLTGDVILVSPTTGKDDYRLLPIDTKKLGSTDYNSNK